MKDLKQILKRLSQEERRKLLPGLSDEGFQQLLALDDSQILETLKKAIADGPPRPAPTGGHWFDKPISGLSSEGVMHLKELNSQLQDPVQIHHVDKKLVHYLQRLKKLRLSPPDIFRKTVDPKALYARLANFCKEKDLPESIAAKLVPVLVEYIETGHMRPVLLVGPAGVGKTTAARLLVEEALQLPAEIIKVPGLAAGHGISGDSGVYQSADCGALAKARLTANSLLVAFIFDEIDKCASGSNNRAICDELLSVTDGTCQVFDNYLETNLPGLEHCPIIFTANTLENVSPYLVDRCFVLHYPEPDANRIKSIMRKYVDKRMSSCSLYSLVQFDHDLIDDSVDELLHRHVTSIRDHEKLAEGVIQSALNLALTQPNDDPVPVTKQMFTKTEAALFDAGKRTIGFAS